MKFTLAALLLLSAVSSHAAVTLGFSTGANAAEGWATHTGDKTMTMVWGILVDTAGDGFDGFLGVTTTPVDGGTLYGGGFGQPYDVGYTLSPTNVLPQGQSMKMGGVDTDDRLFLSTNLMALVSGDVRITTLTSMTYAANMAAGDKYAIVWFETTALNSTVTAFTYWGAWSKDGVSPTASTTLPADPGSYTTAVNGPAGMFGADGTSSTKLALFGIPEPSSALLGLLGAVGLLRRRR